MVVTAGPGADADADAERRLVRKLDLHVYPILFVIYVFSFLDRINISNARIQGLVEDLDLTGNRFNIALFVYFIPYLLLEIPSNMIIKKMRPSLYLSALMAAWGLVNMCMGFVKTYQGLVVLRFFLGVLEAGVTPGIIYLTSMYYKRHELVLRTTFFFCSTVVAGAFGGLLAYAIANLNGHNGLSAWRWIFIIEGAATAVVSLASAFLIPDWPEQARFLNASEKALLRARLLADGPGGHDVARMDRLDARAWRLILTDWKIWCGAAMYLGLGITGYSTVFFLPTILLEFGWTASSAQVHTIPVYAVTAVFMLGVAWLSDRLRHRYGFILAGVLLTTAGYAVLLSQGDGHGGKELGRGAKYAAVFLVSLGGYATLPLAIAWLANNVSGHWKRALSSGIQITVGNVAGIVASNIFLPGQAPTYPAGYGTALALTWLGGLAATAMFVGARRENRLRDAGERDDRLLRPRDEVENMGDYHPAFRFTL
ncbi:major facilitator superfamily domain-containing protein [Xylariaceae sp. FL0804]|nr:major facilitator superfamily domain-containing protein [Xylariaceae sp. FL0804]